jgi:hypothetical protein
MGLHKLRAGARQNDLARAEDTVENLAVLDLATSTLLYDSALLGPSMILLAGRNCSVSCGPVGRRPRSIRERGFGPID